MPEEKPKVYFDAEKEVTADDWEKMKTALEVCRQSEDWDGFIAIAVDMKIIFPERAEELNLDKFDKETLERIAAQFPYYSSQDDPSNATMVYDFGKRALKMKILFPEKSKLIFDEKRETGFESRIKELRRLTDNVIEAGDSGSAENMAKFAFPDLAKKLQPMDEKRKTRIEGLLKEKLDYAREKGFWSEFFRAAAYEKLLHPFIVQPNLNGNDWESMKKENASGKQRWVSPSSSLAQRVANMKILAAEKVEITDNGLEIVMPEENKK